MYGEYVFQLYMDHVEILAAVGEDDGITIKLCEHLIVKQSIKCVHTYLSPSPSGL